MHKPVWMGATLHRVQHDGKKCTAALPQTTRQKIREIHSTLAGFTSSVAVGLSSHPENDLMNEAK